MSDVHSPSGNLKNLMDLGSRASLDAELKSLIARHGSNVVREAAARLTKRKVGRPAERDFPLMEAEWTADAIDLIAGRDPFKCRSNYSVANRFAQKHGGHNTSATCQRLLRKLKRNREWIGLMTARGIAGTSLEYGWPDYLLICERIANLPYRTIGEKELARVREELRLYRVRYGEPAADLPFVSIRVLNSAPLPEVGTRLGDLAGGRALAAVEANNLAAAVVTKSAVVSTPQNDARLSNLE